jgi:hypothetical protein
MSKLYDAFETKAAELELAADSKPKKRLSKELIESVVPLLQSLLKAEGITKFIFKDDASCDLRGYARRLHRTNELGPEAGNTSSVVYPDPPCNPNSFEEADIIAYRNKIKEEKLRLDASAKLLAKRLDYEQAKFLHNKDVQLELYESRFTSPEEKKIYEPISIQMKGLYETNPTAFNAQEKVTRRDIEVKLKVLKASHQKIIVASSFHALQLGRDQLGT